MNSEPKFKKYLNHSIFPLATLIASTAILIFFRYKEILLNLTTDKCAGPLRDGIKTFTNIIFHAKYGNSYTWFSGMNYPYEEHIMAATELPGFAILFRFLTQFFPNITDYTFGIIHLFLLATIILCAYFIFKIFWELKVPSWIAIPASIAITFLAPQHLRFAHHLGLFPLFVIPAVLYFLLKFNRERHWKHCAFIGLVIFVASFFHFYFFAILVLYVSFYFFIDGIQKPSIPHLKRLTVQYFTVIALPLLFFTFWMILNDKVSDRTPTPYGFFAYNSNASNLFSSPILSTTDWFKEHLFKFVELDFEGWNYIGLVADLFIIIVLFRWAILRFKKGLFSFIPEKDRTYILNIFLAGGIMAYLSCSQPFIMKGWEFLLEYTGPYKQFRSTGRFAWAFYFSINIVAVTGFYQLLKTIKKQYLANIILGTLGLILCYEAWEFQNSKNHLNYQTIEYAPDYVPGKKFTDLVDIDFSRYQAIIPIPLYLVGSGNVVDDGGAYSIQQSLTLSAQTGIPVTGAMLTRSSRSQAYRQMQLATEPYRSPSIFADYPTDKPLLLLDSHIKSEGHQKKYGHLLQGSQLIFKTEKWSLYEMQMDDFEERILNKKQAIKTVLADGVLFNIDNLLSTDSLKNYIWLDFDELNSKKIYFGAGGYEGAANEFNTLFKGKLPNQQAGIPYSMSAWVNIEEDKFAQMIIRVNEILPTGEVNILGQKPAGWAANVFDSNGWVLAEIPFVPTSSDSEIEVWFKIMNDRDERRIFIDELLIKPDSTDLYLDLGDRLWWNNRNY